MVHLYNKVYRRCESSILLSRTAAQVPLVDFAGKVEHVQTQQFILKLDENLIFEFDVFGIAR